MPAAVHTRPDACPGVFAPHDAADGALARIRLPGGVISAAALRAVADCADELGDGRLHLTSRGNLQLRGLSRSGALVARLTAAGLLPSVTHERVRNVLASPLAGIAGDPVARADVAGSTTREAGARDEDRLARVEMAAAGAVHARATGSRDRDPQQRVDSAEAGAADTRGVGSCEAPAVALDRGLCGRPGLAELPGRFLFALDDGCGDVAAEDPDLCWQAPGRLLVAGVDTGLHVPAADAVAVLLDAAETFLALRAADDDRVPGRGGAWRAAELDDAPARIAAALAGGQPSPMVNPEPAAELVDPAARIATVPAGGEPSPAVNPEPAAELVDAAARIATVPAGGEPSPAVTPGPAAGLQQGGPAPSPWQRGHPAPTPWQQDHPAATAPAPGPPRAAVPGPVPRDDGGLALVVAPLLGELTSAQARLLADAGPTAVVTPWRTIVLPDPAVPAAVLAAAGLLVEPGPAALVSACAGRPGCANALADVRADTLAAIGRLQSGRVHVSGCARRCGAPHGPHVDAVALAGGGYLVDGVARPGLAP